MPDDWTVVTIENCCEILDRYRVPVNSDEREGRIGEIPYYGANGLQGFIDSHIFDEPLILIAEDGGRFEEYATRPIAYRVSGKSWVNNHAHVLRAKCDFDQDAIFYALEHKDIQHFIVGGTRAKLNQGALKAIQIKLADSKHEQSKIAEILSTVDQAIEQTEALIAKLQRIKTGLMQDLLTRGIDAHGQLRTEPTHAFKDSPLGRIPVEWEVDALDKVTSDIVDCPHTTPNFLPSGIVVARTFNLKDGQFVGARSYVSEMEYASRVSRLEPLPGDVIFTREAPVGEAFVVPPEMKICLGQRTMQIRCKSNRLLPEFFVEFVYAEETRIRFDQMVGGTTNPHLNVSDVRSLLLRLPGVDEQNRIVLRIGAVRNSIQQSLKQREKLASLKTALMQDLLTGHKRVTDLLESAAA